MSLKVVHPGGTAITFYGFFMLLPLFVILFLLYMLMTKQSRRPHMYNQPHTEQPQRGRAMDLEIDHFATVEAKAERSWKRDVSLKSNRHLAL